MKDTILALLICLSFSGSAGNAASLTCSKVFTSSGATAELIQDIARKNFDKKIKSTGYASVEQIRERLKSGGYYNVISPESLTTKFAAGLRAPENLREKILAEGFKNQHELKARGSENLEKMIETESGIYGFSKEEFANIPDHDKPLYAALVSRPEHSMMRNSNLDRYGDDLWITKRDVIDRATWTPIDSWAIKNDFMGLSWDKTVKLFSDRDWTYIAMPAQLLDLAIPFLKADGKVTFPQKRGGGSYESFYKGRIMPPMSRNIVDFIEFQIWGGLKSRDISDFVFYKNPPTPDQLQGLAAAGIRVWDGRQDGAPVLIQP